MNDAFFFVYIFTQIFFQLFTSFQALIFTTFNNKKTRR